MLEQHLVCAALEHPLSFLYDEIYFGSGLESAVMTLKNKGLLVCNISQDKSAQIWSYIGHEVLAHLNAVPLMQLIEWRKYLHFWFLLFVCACFFFFFKSMFPYNLLSLLQFIYLLFPSEITINFCEHSGNRDRKIQSN